MLLWVRNLIPHISPDALGACLCQQTFVWLLQNLGEGGKRLETKRPSIDKLL